MYSQAYVREESVLRPPARALPSVIVDTEKVLREADGSVKLVVVRPHTDGKVFAPGCASKPDGESREQPEEHKRYFIDPEDTEFKETIKNARKKLETSVAPAIPCKILKNCGSGASNKIKTKLACILEADESARTRMGNSMPHYHQDHVAGKGENSLQHYNLVHKFIPMPQAMKIREAKSSGRQGMGKIGENFGLELD